MGWQGGDFRFYQHHLTPLRLRKIPRIPRIRSVFMSGQKDVCVLYMDYRNVFFAYRGFLGTKDQRIPTMIIIATSLQKKDCISETRGIEGLKYAQRL